jgi:glycosyltransferase involved in cell wall biosynthesis
MPLLRKHDQKRNLQAAADIVRTSEFFDPDWYVTHNAGGLKVVGDAALHYVRYGRRYGFEPGPRFSGQRYLERYPDVAAHDMDPLVHYLRYGRYENRVITGKKSGEGSQPTATHRARAASTAMQSPGRASIQAPAVRSSPAPSRKLGRKGLREQAELVRNSKLFDEAWYVDTHLEGVAPPDPIVHYLTTGSPAGFDPGPSFSNRRYLAAYPDVAKEDIDPLIHYVLHGSQEGRIAYAVPVSEMRRQVPTTPAPRPATTPLSTTAASGPTDTITTPIVAGSPSILFVSGEPDTPGNFYRVINYVDAAKANGWRADWVRGDQLADRMAEVGDFDVLVIWRMPWNAHLEEAIAIMRSSGRTVAFDCDDLMTEPRLATFHFIDGIRSNRLTEQMVHDHFSLIRQTMLAADVCFTTTDQLAFHMRWSDKATFVNPNGFTQFTHDLSRRSAREWATQRDGLVRIGYAGGSRTHQKDLAVAIGGISRILREHPECRLVLFRSPVDQEPLVDVEEFPDLDGLHDQIEWRPLQPLKNLPTEKARFDINLAPLEVGNPFCEAKSQLKFFEAALVDCPTIASPTGPFRDCISHGKTGFLAASGDDWYSCLKELVTDANLRNQVGRNAYVSALADFGPRRRALQFGCVLDQLRGGSAAARGFALSTNLPRIRPALPAVYPYDTVFEADKGGQAEVAVVIPLYNYDSVVVEALDSVRDQTLACLDLIIVDDCSPDNSLKVALSWAKRNADRFNRIAVLKNRDNYKLGLCRNSGFDAADAPYIMQLDADNHLLPECCEKLLAAIEESGAAFVYPTIQQFGASTRQISNTPYRPQRFAAGNYVDAMAMVSKEAWAMVGGYHHVRHGWEDYDLWARLAEIGLAGEWLPEVLAEYRVHATSMMKSQTLVDTNYRELHRDFSSRHPWVALVDVETRRYPINGDPRLTTPGDRTRLDDLLPILRCPVTGRKLAYDEARTGLVSLDGLARWPLKEGRPCLSQDLSDPQVMPEGHISNELPEEALEVIRETKGWVLNLSAGGSREKFDHVVEMEYAVFRHTDIVGDAHYLPFDDNCFDAVVVMNAFEHYHDPRRVAAELFRVLKPGGRIHIRTAFLQPLHEKPYHFYNCTRYGMERWFEAFETELMHVSTNFCPNHTLAWVASEAEAALRTDVSDKAADDFLSAPIAQLVESWRDPATRDTPLWTDFERLSQEKQEIIAAGFELFGKRPPDLPKL